MGPAGMSSLEFLFPKESRRFGRKGRGLVGFWTFLDSTARTKIYFRREFSCCPRIAETNPPTLAHGKRFLAPRKEFIQ